MEQGVGLCWPKASSAHRADWSHIVDAFIWSFSYILGFGYQVRRTFKIFRTSKLSLLTISRCLTGLLNGNIGMRVN